MSPEIEVGGAWKPITSAQVYVGTSWRNITRGEYYDGTTWKAVATFISTLSISVDPQYSLSYRFGIGSASMETGTITATPSGGLGPYRYSHAVTDPSFTTATAFTNGTSASTVLLAQVPGNTSASVVARVTVTDARGSTAFSDYFANFENASDL